MIYDWVKVLHILAIISWMAGLLYLPRLMVYHAQTPAAGETSTTFKVMERRLLNAIMTPAMIVAWVSGLWMAWSGGWLASSWFHAKVVVIIGMSAAHAVMACHVRSFATDANLKTHRYFRVLNEIPTLLMIFAVGLVVLKPWS